MPELDQLFQCRVNRMSRLWNGLTTKHYWLVPFWINFFLVKVFLSDCQLNKNWKHVSLYYDGQFNDPLFIAHSFNQLQRACCICNLARITGKNLATLKSLGVLADSEEFWRQLIWARDHPHSQKAKSLNAKVSWILSMVGSTIIQSFWTCSNPSKIECYAILLWCWLKFHDWCATWVWRFSNVETLYEAKIQWSKLCYIKMRFHTIRFSWSNT